MQYNGAEMEGQLNVIGERNKLRQILGIANMTFPQQRIGRFAKTAFENKEAHS